MKKRREEKWKSENDSRHDCMRRAKATTGVKDSQRLSGHSLIGVPDLA